MANQSQYDIDTHTHTHTHTHCLGVLQYYPGVVGCSACTCIPPLHTWHHVTCRERPAFVFCGVAARAAGGSPHLAQRCASRTRAQTAAGRTPCRHEGRVRAARPGRGCPAAMPRSATAAAGASARLCGAAAALAFPADTHTLGEDEPAAVLCGMGGVMPWRRTILALSFNRRRRAFLLSVASCVGSVRWRFVPRRLPLPAPPPLPAFSSSWALAAATSTPRKPRHFAEPQRHRSSSFVLNCERIQVESGVGQSVSTGFYATW